LHFTPLYGQKIKGDHTLLPLQITLTRNFSASVEEDLETLKQDPDYVGEIYHFNNYPPMREITDKTKESHFVHSCNQYSSDYIFSPTGSYETNCQLIGLKVEKGVELPVVSVTYLPTLCNSYNCNLCYKFTKLDQPLEI
jgi:hypothetical protein